MTKIIYALVILLSLGCMNDKEIDAGDINTIDAGIKDAGFSYFIPKEDSTVEDIIYTWRKLFNEDKISGKDWRRQKFSKYAEIISTSIKKLQKQNKLPSKRHVSILIATLIYHETRVNPFVKGRSHNEVGFMQVHGVALAGYKRKIVQQDPALGTNLGLRWLARTITMCDTNNFNTWNLSDWRGPLAIYNGGEARAKTNGKCDLNWRYAKSKIRITKNILEQLD